MANTRHIPIGERAVLDHRYKKGFEDRLAATENEIARLNSIRQGMFTFEISGAAEIDVLLPYEPVDGFAPIVAIGGATQAAGRDYEVVAPKTIRFSESLIQGDVVTVVLTYSETI